MGLRSDTVVWKGQEYRNATQPNLPIMYYIFSVLF